MPVLGPNGCEELMLQFFAAIGTEVPMAVVL